MRPQTRKFEVQFNRTRNAIERKGISMIRAAIIEQYKQFLARALQLPQTQWDQIIVSSDPVKQFFYRFYPMSGRLALMTRKHLIQKKDAEDDVYLSIFERQMQHIVTTADYAARITTITNTTNKRINSVLQSVFEEAELNGYGIDKTRDTLIKEMGSAIRGNVRARAKAIAQTEMTSAANQASRNAADSTNLEYRKYWSTSHLKGVRDSHMQAEQDSIDRGGLRSDQLHSNGLLYPGDPSGSPEEICNCRCTELYEIV